MDVSFGLSVFVITKNEAESLPECLRHFQHLCEIVVLDSGSADDTVRVARAMSARVFSRPDWAGFGAQKQRALDLTTAPWVISLDADEVASNELVQEILMAISSPSGYNGFYIKRQNFFLGRHLRFGGWGGDWVLRLAQRSKCHFDEALVHERLIVQGPLAKLRSPLRHYSYASAREIMRKREAYATMGAKLLASKGRRCSGEFESTLRAIWTFFNGLILKLGFLDGPIGFYAAYCKAAETKKEIQSPI